MVTIDKKNIHLFFYFMWERQNVYHRRFELKLDPPWTDDLILREYKFTNVYRELDKTTIWYHDFIGGYPNKRAPNFEREIDIVFATFVHRLFNRIETMQPMLPYLTVKTYNHDALVGVLEGMRSQGLNVFTSAHLTTGVRFGGFDDKLYNILYLIEHIHKDIKEIYASLKAAVSLEDLYERTRMVQGFGPFLGYQFILDMVNSGISPFDHDDFVVAGPGCKRGIRLVFPNADEITFENAMRYIRKYQHKYFDKYGYDFKFVEHLGGKEKGIHLGNVENCFCEMSKFHRAYIGAGRPRNRFSPAIQLEMKLNES